ncbi:MAG: hypothetical protein R3B06_06790 [Kofleriaceae bacterium]
MGDPDQTRLRRSETDHASTTDALVANDNGAEPGRSPGAGYLGGDAHVASRTTGVAGFANPDAQTYAHGAMMGAAGEFMKDALWNQIFRSLWASEYERVAALTDVAAVMGALENNPILAAYGECKTLEHRGQAAGRAEPSTAVAGTKVLPQEWDVWLDPAAPGDLTHAKIAHGNKMTTMLQGANQDRVTGYGRDDVRTSKNGPQWLELFGRAVAMYRGGAAPEGGAATGDRQAAMQRAAAATTAAAAIDLAIDFLRAENGGGLVLDVKSTYSTAGDIQIFVDALQARGINVIGVGTFRHDQLAGLEAGVRPVKFYHGLSGVQLAAVNGELHDGDHLMFNAGSLITKSGGWVRAESYAVDESAVQAISDLVTRLHLHVGLYVQETAIDEHAVNLIVRLVNRLPDVFKDGFAYGNISGAAETETTGTGMGAQQPLENVDHGKLLGAQARDGAVAAGSAVAAGAREAGGRLRDGAVELGGRMQEGAGRLRDGASELGGRMQEGASQLGERAGEAGQALRDLLPSW